MKLKQNMINTWRNKRKNRIVKLLKKSSRNNKKK